MKKVCLLIGLLSLLLTGCDLITGGGNGGGGTEEPDAPSFSFTVTQTAKFPNLPALQSFVLGQSGSKWLIFGGRTNGFHGFGEASTFPFKKANKFIYAYDTQTQQLDSLSLKSLPKQIREQFESSNMLGTQVNGMLYVAGGYGEINAGTPDSAFITHPVLTRIHVANVIAAIEAQDAARMGSELVFIEDDFFRSTGGELYMLEDGRFYLTLGHNYEGIYNPSGEGVTQIYLDSVRTFYLTEDERSITLDKNSILYLSDNKPPAQSQFHRRDLLVVPHIEAGGQAVGLSIFGGVFTPDKGRPYRNPIYIMGGVTPSFTVDKDFVQRSNIYSAANVRLYSAKEDKMYTTVLGGMGDTTVAYNDDFTRLITTLIRDNQGGKTTALYNKQPLPAYLGSEAIFIPSGGVTMFRDNYGVIDFDALPEGKTLLGYMYGGILSKSPKWSKENPTVPTNAVYEVRITK
ncbi:MAG: hypothetical protein AAFP83_11110 [Bacteroidota bacterium]